MSIYRVLVIAFYTFTLWYDINYIGMKYNQEAQRLNFFLEGRLYFLTGEIKFKQNSNSSKNNIIYFINFYCSLEHDHHHYL
jgi:hypothetical protein